MADAGITEKDLHARNIAPIMPGTLETRAPEEDDSVVVRTGVQVCVNNILRDLKNTSSYIEQLNKHVQSSDKCRNEYSVLINTHTMGEAIEELVSEQTIYGAPIFNNPNVVNSMTVSWKVNDLLGKKVEEASSLAKRQSIAKKIVPSDSTLSITEATNLDIGEMCKNIIKRNASLKSGDSFTHFQADISYPSFFNR
ncbi:hypothetical protein GCK72_011826 [Caenorhabditis remanei]|uniref:Uncharacterized protein n=1 Tax=Caenorhabditis remanei TaxID=31234 RepID=A0A6A5H6V1_CAERE|nr:hypothetical protein GCK72_011826 [Caenorhabditis remanei]KAF1763560.1 hypothetical protein GCK72_011826 [Caenorhabditis remanei]